MPIGIDPTVDFAFKLMLGNPEHPAVTIHFLNAILKPAEPITAVEILNPIQGKERPDEKLVVLDILAEDSLGRRFNVEMQTTRQTDLPRRLLYYSSLSYARQITEGEYYTKLRPVFSICVLDVHLFPLKLYPRYHHSFRLRCDQENLVLTNDFEFHTLELPKFTPSSDNISTLPADEKWLYLLRNAKSMDSQQLISMLSDPPFQEAIGVLEMISKSSEDLQFYEARLKFLRDQQSQIEAAKDEGLAKGREEGREEGLVHGKLAGQIQLLEQLLGNRQSSDAALESQTLEALAIRLDDLQQQLRDRPS